MKTPDETKKGLECCAASYADCHKECPYKPDCDGSQILKDALALIQQLQAQNTEKDATIQQLESGLLAQADVIATMGGRIQQLEAERDAAVADLADRCGSKTLCKKYDDGTCPHEFDCTFYLSTCQDFEWRGVTKEE